MGLLADTNETLKNKHAKVKNLGLRTLNKISPLADQLEIRIELFDKTDDLTKSSIDNAFQKVFNRSLRKHEENWAKPKWVALVYLYRELVSFCYVIESKIFLNHEKVKIGGIGGVMTLPAYRGMGIVSELLDRMDKFMFDVLNVDYGLLVCDESLITFYRERGWYTVDCPVYYKPGNRLKLFEGNTMLKSVGNDQYQPDAITIAGKLW